MNRRPLWEVRAAMRAPDADAAALVFAELLGAAPAVYVGEHTRRAAVSAFLPRRPAADTLQRLRQALRRVVSSGAAPTVRRVKPENWAESWKRHFQPLTFGDALLVKPGWSRRRARPGQAVVVLDPGLSFGTGQHATTRFCLRELVRGRSRDRRAPRSFLDMGTGSGILAIAAAKLGYHPVAAFDFDPDAVRVARANAGRNRVARRLRLTRQDLARLPLRAPQTFDVVCANLTADLLLRHARRITARVASGGRLVLAGILDTQFDAVQRHYEQTGWRLLRTRREGEWRSGTFERTL
jgi:ribosomal protein L11 methyltransferase